MKKQMGGRTRLETMFLVSFILHILRISDLHYAFSTVEGDEEGIENPEDSEGSEYQAFETNFAEPVESGSGRDVEADVNAEKAIEGDFRYLTVSI